jgi:hypothetical protein
VRPGTVPSYLEWLSELGMGLPMIHSSSAYYTGSPSITVCSWTLNWGRIRLENVTIVGLPLSKAADAVVKETGKGSGP